jgi:hypothetical protein
MRPFNNETELAENEYLLKIREDEGWSYGNIVVEDSKTGFLTKLNKGNLKPPKPFLDWGKIYMHSLNTYVDHIPEIWIVEQNFCKGWRLGDYRRGTSADWIVVTHPDGYDLEVKTNHFMNLVPYITITKGLIKESLKWNNGELILKNGKNTI